MIEILFQIIKSVSSSKLSSVLLSRLKQIHKGREKELDQINEIVFGDPKMLRKYYVGPSCQEINPADRRVDDEKVPKQPIMKKIDRFFKEEDDSNHPGSNQLIVLSDAGMGKSALLAMLKLMHLTDHNYVLKKLGHGSLDEIKAIKNRRRTILLLDSLDMDPMANGRVKERLIEVLDASQNFSKVIITCRTQFFPKDNGYKDRLPGKISLDGFLCHLSYLSFFNKEKVNQYLSKRFKKRFLGLGIDKNKIVKAQSITDKMGSLSYRPMLLSYIKDLMKWTLTKKGDNGYQIFDALIDSWLKLEWTKNRDLNIDGLHDACLILAVWMQSHQKRQISETELNQLIEKISRKFETVTQINMKGRTFLNKNSAGDYRFSHSIVQEFCVAKFLCEKPNLRFSAKIPINNEIAAFLNDFSVSNPDADNLPFALIEITPAQEYERKIFKYGMEFVYIPPGVFKMGSPENKFEDNWEQEHRDITSKYLKPELHDVIVAQCFYMQTTPVTQKQWHDVMGKNPSFFKGNDDRPVECVSWHDAQKFINTINQKEKEMLFALPSEAQWEYACRADTRTRFYSGDSEEDLDRAGWYEKNSGGRPQPVGQKEPNKFGLYDMHGNVWEWVEDKWHKKYKGAPVDGSARLDDPEFKEKIEIEPEKRVARGGGWDFPAKWCGACCRFDLVPAHRINNQGFRLVLLQSQPG